MPRCAVPRCNNNGGHIFPKDPILRKKWEKAIRRKKFKATNSTRICRDHFHKDDYMGVSAYTGRQQICRHLNKGAVPSIFSWTKSTDEHKQQNRTKKKTKQNKKKITQRHETESENDTSPKEENTIIECRTCLQIMNTKSSFFNIYDGWMSPWEGMENTMAEDLAKLTSIEIFENDKLSHMICESCCQILLTASSFVATVRKNDKILKERYEETKETDYLSNDRTWPKPIQVDKSLPFENPLDIDIKQEVVSDDECLGNGFDEHNTEDEIIPNLDIVKVEPEEIQQKPIQVQVIENGNLIHKPHTDEENVNNMDECETHLTNGNMGDEYTEATIKEEPFSEEEDMDPCISDLSLECMLCAKIFNSVSGLKAHVIAHHSYKSVKRKSSTSLSPERKKRKYTCAICRRSFATSTDLMVHETCHNKSVCYGCNESFDTFDQLTKHRRKCKAISSKVTRTRTLDDVLRPQSKEPPQELKCMQCEEKFTDTYYLNIHQEIHHSADLIEHKNPYMMSLKLCTGNDS